MSDEETEVVFNEKDRRRFWSMVEHMQETQGRNERRRAADHEQAVEQLDKARRHMDETREYYSSRLRRSTWLDLVIHVMAFVVGCLFMLVMSCILHG